MSAEPIGYHCSLCGQVGAWEELVQHPSGGLGCSECLTTEGVVPLLHRPRCSTCKWWAPAMPFGFAGDCNRMHIPGDRAPVTASDHAGERLYTIHTVADFGCVEWEPQERRDG